MKTSLISRRGAVITLAALMSVFSIWLVHADQAMTWWWVAFGLHFFSVAMIVIVSVVRSEIRELELKTRARSKTHLLLFLFIAAYAVLMNTLFLTTYPFVAEGDEVRDGGLNAMEIANGTKKNLFEYGAYGSHGLIIPEFTSFFYRFLPNSVLVWRIPATVLGIAGVLLVFFFMVRTTTIATAFWSAFVLANLPLHLFYGRTQVVVIWSSTLTIAMIIAITRYLKHRTMGAAMLVAAIAGFSSNFHASARTVALIIVGMTIVLVAVNTMFHRRPLIERVLRTAMFIGIVVLFYLIAVGPRLLYTSSNVFFQRSRAMSLKSFFTLSPSSLREDFSTLSDRYRESLLIYGVKPTSSWYPDHRSILPGFLYPFFLVGILVALTKHRPTMWPALVLAAVIPLTNSAITEGVNFDHRLAPLFPISAILTGIGITWFLKNIRQERWLWTISILTIGGLIVWMGTSFFVNQPAVKDKTIRQYVSMHLARFLSIHHYSRNIRYCLFVHPDQVEYFTYQHIREQYVYFAPGFSYELRASTTLNLGKNEAYLSPSCSEAAARTLLLRVPCSRGNIMKSLFCPTHGEYYPDIRIWGEPGAFR